jgi:hypothetical protein
MLQCAVCGTSDKGTEAGLASLPSTSFAEYFPYFDTSEFEDDGGDSMMGAGNGGTFLSTPNALSIGGKMHIVSRLSKGLLFAMPHYKDDVHEMLNGLNNFLHSPWLRERLRKQCFGTGPLSAFAPLFLTWPWTLNQWRWFSLCPIVFELLNRKRALRAGWSLAALRFQGDPGAQNQDHEQEDGPSLETANKAVRSNYFWGWLSMAEVLILMLSHIEAWFMSCPCHHKSPNKTWSGRSMDFKKRLDIAFTSCPLGGRRLPQLAAGDFELFIQALTNMATIELTLGWTADLTAEERTMVTEDFEAGRKHMAFALAVFTAPYKQLPRMLGGLAHPDPLKCRGCFVTALQQWGVLTDVEQAAAHPVSKLFCHPESIVCQQALRWLDVSTELDNFPELFYHVSRLALIPMNEISIESKHAVIKQMLNRGPNVGAASLSLAQRFPPILARMDSEPEFLLELATTCSSVYHPINNIRLSGIAGHPDLIEALSSATYVNPHGNLTFALGSTMKYAKPVTIKRRLPCVCEPTFLILSYARAFSAHLHARACAHWHVSNNSLNSLRNKCVKQNVCVCGKSVCVCVCVAGTSCVP